MYHINYKRINPKPVTGNLSYLVFIYKVIWNYVIKINIHCKSKCFFIYS